jgi:hypothetical protein
MNRKELLLAPLRIVLLIVGGLTHAILIMLGWIYACELFQDTYPVLSHLRKAGGIIALLFLVWPAYIITAIETRKRRQAEDHRTTGSS